MPKRLGVPYFFLGWFIHGIDPLNGVTDIIYFPFLLWHDLALFCHKEFVIIFVLFVKNKWEQKNKCSKRGKYHVLWFWRGRLLFRVGRAECWQSWYFWTRLQLWLLAFKAVILDNSLVHLLLRSLAVQLQGSYHSSQIQRRCRGFLLLDNAINRWFAGKINILDALKCVLWRSWYSRVQICIWRIQSLDCRIDVSIAVIWRWWRNQTFPFVVVCKKQHSYLIISPLKYYW